jgi:hypothetical protein
MIYLRQGLAFFLSSIPITILLCRFEILDYILVCLSVLTLILLAWDRLWFDYIYRF